MIVVIPDPKNWERWEEARTLLEPARARGNFADVIEPDEALFAVMEGNDLLAVATAWLGIDNATGEKRVEVKLIGGRDHRRWIKELNDVIGARAREAEATRLIAIGRRGWWKTIASMGWDQCQAVDDHWLFERKL